MWGPHPHKYGHQFNLFCVRTGGDHSQANAAPPLQEKPLRDPFDSARTRRAPLRMTQGEKRRISR